MIIEQKSLDVSLDSEKDYDNNIYYFILSALLGGAEETVRQASRASATNEDHNFVS